MFVQVIEGHTSDPEGLARYGESWQEKVGPVAVGFVGVTAGSTADGRTVTFACFESEAAARKNEALAEQSAWAEGLGKYYDAPPTFTESTDVEQLFGGPAKDAGFVQVMKVSSVDRVKAKELDDSFDTFKHLRPDLLGTLRVWTGPDSFVEANYFESEAAARAGEKAEMPPEVDALMAEFGDAMANTEFLDLTLSQVR
jgi:hypothetical protein